MGGSDQTLGCSQSRPPVGTKTGGPTWKQAMQRKQVEMSDTLLSWQGSAKDNIGSTKAAPRPDLGSGDLACPQKHGKQGWRSEQE